MLNLLAQDFVQKALIGSVLVAISAGAIGYFVILRKDIFITHTLSHIGFPGGVLATLVGLQPAWGLVAFSVIGGIAFIITQNRRKHRDESDVTTGIILAFCMALGLVLSRFSPVASRSIDALLFGSIFTLNLPQLIFYAAVAVIALVGLSLVFKKLLFASVLETEARAKGLPVSSLAFGYMLVLSIIVAISAQVIGTLLIFALIILPPAIAIKIWANPKLAFAGSSLIGCFIAFTGIISSLIWNLQPSFCIVAIATLLYLIVSLKNKFRHQK
jgi:zinc/manganese transport system permease protein